MRKSFAFVLVLGSLASQAVAGVVINANVNGTVQQIGSLDTSISTNDPARIFGTFTLDPAFKGLDDWYDFQWVNVETKYTVGGVPQANDPVVGKLPAIDPQPKPTNPNEDNKPYYWNDGEWLPSGKNLTFGTGASKDTVKIHVEGQSSMFVDRPSDGTKDSQIDFTTFLVVDNLTDPMFSKTDFVVLGWFNWTYDNAKGVVANQSTSIGTTSGVVDDGMVKLINDAIGNAGKDGFGTYKAVRGQELMFCPEPGTLSLAAGGILIVVGLRRRSRSAA